jgi:hypothetical protein
MPGKESCNRLGKTHQWQERKELYSPWSSQSVGSYWLCITCGARSDEKPTDSPGRRKGDYKM